MKRRTLLFPIISAVLALGLLSGCAVEETAWRGLPWVENERLVTGGADSDAVAITLSDSGSRCAGKGVTVKGSTITITAAGDYSLSGMLSDGQLVIDATREARVRLILNSVTLLKNGGAAIYAKSAGKLELVSAADSENLVQARGKFEESGEDPVDAAIWAGCGLTLSGEGVLNISSLTGHALVSKAALELKSGVVNLEAALKGLYGKDSVTVAGGILNADVGTDALCADSEESGKGTIRVSGGVLNLLAQKDGLDAAGDVDISGGVLTLSAGSVQEGKGIVSAGSIDVSGGSLSLSAVDDAIHAAGDVTLSGAALVLASGDDGVHADGTLHISGGSLDVQRSYAGLEGQVVHISGGAVRVVSRDDGLNAAGGNDGSNAGGLFGADRFAADSDAAITISGGTLRVSAEGDGLDSKGSLTVSGGTLTVSGPSFGMNGALDYGAEARVTGGTVVAVGTADMAKNFGDASTQGSILLKLASTQAAGTLVAVCDEKGTILASFEPEKRYSAVLVSAPGLVRGGTGTVMAGTELYDFTLESLICGR